VPGGNSVIVRRVVCHEEPGLVITIFLYNCKRRTHVSSHGAPSGVGRTADATRSPREHAPVPFAGGRPGSRATQAHAVAAGPGKRQQPWVRSRQHGLRGGTLGLSRTPRSRSPNAASIVGDAVAPSFRAWASSSARQALRTHGCRRSSLWPHAWRWKILGSVHQDCVQPQQSR